MALILIVPLLPQLLHSEVVDKDNGKVDSKIEWNTESLTESPLFFSFSDFRHNQNVNTVGDFLGSPNQPRATLFPLAWSSESWKSKTCLVPFYCKGWYKRIYYMYLSDIIKGKVMLPKSRSQSRFSRGSNFHDCQCQSHYWLPWQPGPYYTRSEGRVYSHFLAITMYSCT